VSQDELSLLIARPPTRRSRRRRLSAISDTRRSTSNVAHQSEAEIARASNVLGPAKSGLPRTTALARPAWLEPGAWDERPYPVVEAESGGHHGSRRTAAVGFLHVKAGGGLLKRR